jgi:hypothetical protein
MKDVSRRKFVRNNPVFNAFKDARLRNFGTAVAIRESRKIIGDYDLTENDVQNEATFPDSIGICPEFIDGFGILYLPTTGRCFEVPYRATLPQGIENLLVAGRAVAGDQVSHAATGQMVCCALTGQGTGVAAALSVHDGVTCREVNVQRLQERLSHDRQGVTLHKPTP